MPIEFKNSEKSQQKNYWKSVDRKSAGAILKYPFFDSSTWIDYEYMLFFSSESLLFSVDSPKVYEKVKILPQNHSSQRSALVLNLSKSYNWILCSETILTHIRLLIKYCFLLEKFSFEKPKKDDFSGKLFDRKRRSKKNVLA